MRKPSQFNNYAKILFLLFAYSLYNTVHAETKTEENNIERLKSRVLEARPKNEVLDLPNYDFRSTNLDIEDSLSFKKSDFEKANFSGTLENPKIITNVDFSSCNLNGADFSHTVIIKCKFNNAQLNKAKFDNAVIKFTSFHGAKLVGSSFTNSDQESVGYDSSNLQCSIWNNANIFRLSFTRSDERGLIKKNIKENHCSHEDAIKTKLFESFKCP